MSNFFRQERFYLPLLAALLMLSTGLSDGGIALATGSHEDRDIHVAFDNVEVRGSGIRDVALAVPTEAQVTTTPESEADVGTPTPPPPTPTPMSAPSGVIPAEWFPPDGKASIVVVNEANGDLIFTMGNQEHRLAAHTQKVIFYDPGTHGYTADDPRFEAYHSQCTLEVGAIYYWYTDDNIVSELCVQIWPYIEKEPGPPPPAPTPTLEVMTTAILPETGGLPGLWSVFVGLSIMIGFTSLLLLTLPWREDKHGGGEEG